MTELKFTYFYSPDCKACQKLKPFISQFEEELNIEMVNNNEDSIIAESYKVEWLPTLVMEHRGNTWKFDSPEMIEEFLTKASNGSI